MIDHVPVMAHEIVEIFGSAPGGYLVDTTFGLGGHSKEINRAFGKKFKIIGIDRDQEIINRWQTNLVDGIELRKMNFSNVASFLIKENIQPISGVLFDLGLNSAQLDEPERGFSFQRPGPLDMRFDRSTGLSAFDAIKSMNEKELIFILKEYGQERNSRSIARAILRDKPERTEQLAQIIQDIVGHQRFTKTAARVYQALRIYLNNELNELQIALKSIIPLIVTGGRIVVLSYHSLEDGITKRLFQLYSGKCFCGPNVPQCICGASKMLKIMTKKPLMAGEDEVAQNPRSRSARLRYAERI